MKAFILILIPIFFLLCSDDKNTILQPVIPVNNLINLPFRTLSHSRFFDDSLGYSLVIFHNSFEQQLFFDTVWQNYSSFQFSYTDSIVIGLISPAKIS